ncbi:MAG: T9SS type A sorting domain-containing protein [bacterium]|nr:T9SS type A sorting domain-containing protein [bacterium]
MISKTKKTSGNWWEHFSSSTEILSSHWAEISRGVFHVISPVPDTVSNGAFSIVLPKTALEYWLASGGNHPIAEQMVHRDIWSIVKSQGLTDWRPYDRWKKVGNLFYFTQLGEGDGFVDMIYKVHKSIGNIAYNGDTTSILYPRAGYNQLGAYNGTLDTVDNFGTIISYGSDQIGSGITVSFRGQLSQYLGTMGHEHGHQTFMPAHITYSWSSFGLGYENFFSPYDMILNDYMQPRDATLNATNVLGDYSSRNTSNGEILKIPVQGFEMFLLASRNKVSKWDRNMLGDTAQISTYDDQSEYGKGLYIYHIENGIYFPEGDISPQDMECADGVFNWQYVGQSAQLPTEYSLYQNYPNPFNPETNIKFDLPKDNFVTIKVYDILGKEIFTLLNDFRNAGRYKITFNGSNFASGIYYYKTKAGEFESIKKMILIK